MITKRDLVLVALITCFLTITLFRVLPIFSSGVVGNYDPWLDWNDDGKIDGKDLGAVAYSFGAGGYPINKTELLIDVNNTYTELLSTINSCNASLIDLQGRVTALESITLPLNDTILTLQSRIDTLNASLLDIVSRTNSLNASVIDIQLRTTSLEGEVAVLKTRVDTLQADIASLNDTVTLLQNQVNTLQTNFGLMNASLTTLQSVVNDLTARVSALEANYSITNLDLAPFAIPFNMTYDTSHQNTTQTSYFDDMPYTSVTLTLNRTSQLLIMFSADAGISLASVNEKTWIICQATVNGNAATPNTIELTPVMNVQLGGGYTHAHLITESACSFNFYYGPVNAGTYTIKIRWYLSATGTGDVWSRTLIVIALPA
jgi:uncharacterized coiled-coil protein SlyX